MNSENARRLKEKNAIRRDKTIGGIAALIVLAFVVYIVVVSNSGGSSKIEPNAREAKQICETAVERQLKAPSTAKFKSNFQYNPSDEHDYRVVTTVDAQNSFGAMVRTEFYCNMTWNPSGRDWTLNRVAQN